MWFQTGAIILSHHHLWKALNGEILSSNSFHHFSFLRCHWCNLLSSRMPVWIVPTSTTSRANVDPCRDGFFVEKSGVSYKGTLGAQKPKMCGCSNWSVYFAGYRLNLQRLNKIGKTKLRLCSCARIRELTSDQVRIFSWQISEIDSHFTDFSLVTSPALPFSIPQREVEKLVVIQGIVASVKYPRDKALGERGWALWLWTLWLSVVGAEGRPQVYQLWECGRGTVQKLQPSFRVSRFLFFCLPLKTSNLGSVPNGYLQANWFVVVVYLLIHSALNHDYGRRVSCVRGFSGDWLYCSAHSFGLQGKCFPRWAGN